MSYITKDKVYSEVYSILNLLGKEYIDKLPRQLYKMIEEKRDTSYCPSYDTSIDINEQNISEQALAMITLFNIKCWSTEEEKMNIQNTLNENEKEYQVQMENMYDLSFLTKKQADTNENIEIKEVTVYKENLFTKIFNKLKGLLKKREGK